MTIKSLNNHVVSKQKCIDYIEKMTICGKFSVEFIHFYLDTTFWGLILYPNCAVLNPVRKKVVVYIKLRIMGYILYGEVPVMTVLTGFSKMFEGCV